MHRQPAVERALDWASRHGYTFAHQAAEEYALPLGLLVRKEDESSVSGFGLIFRLPSPADVD